MAASELGWTLCGSSRALLAVARHRARVFSSHEGTIYQDLPALALGLGAERSWAFRSAYALKSAGVTIWEERPASIVHLDDYVELVRGQLAAKDAVHARSRASQHNAVVPYSVFQSVPSPHLQVAQRLALPAETQLCLWSWCRFRSGLIPLRGPRGCTSRARLQPCKFCGQIVRNAVVHCLSSCTAWEAQREAFCVAACVDRSFFSKDELARKVLDCVPGHDAFPVVAAWFDIVDRAAAAAWKSVNQVGQRTVAAPPGHQPGRTSVTCVGVLAVHSLVVGRCRPRIPSPTAPRAVDEVKKKKKKKKGSEETAYIECELYQNYYFVALNVSMQFPTFCT